MSKKKIAFLSVSVALLLSLLGGALFGQATQKANPYRYLSIFTEVFDLVRNNYVEQVPPDQLMDGAFSGVTDAIDEFSYYVPPPQMAAYKNFSDVEDNGVGHVETESLGHGPTAFGADGGAPGNLVLGQDVIDCAAPCGMPSVRLLSHMEELPQLVT